MACTNSCPIVQENVCNKAKKRKKSRFWILKKKLKNVKKT